MNLPMNCKQPIVWKIYLNYTTKITKDLGFTATVMQARSVGEAKEAVD